MPHRLHPSPFELGWSRHRLSLIYRCLTQRLLAPDATECRVVTLCLSVCLWYRRCLAAVRRSAPAGWTCQYPPHLSRAGRPPAAPTARWRRPAAAENSSSRPGRRADARDATTGAGFTRPAAETGQCHGRYLLYISLPGSAVLSLSLTGRVLRPAEALPEGPLGWHMH